MNFSVESKSRAICILGMHRSGTSAIARAINLLGAYIGEESELWPPGFDNPEGFWELTSIVNLQERILHTFGLDWDTTISLPEKWWVTEKIQPYRSKLKDIIIEKFINKKIWVWKDPRTCLLLPLWKDILNELNVEVSYIIPVRNPLSVASSLEKRNGLTRIHALGIWNLYTLASLFYTNGTNRILVDYDIFLENWEDILRNISNTLSIPWPANEVLLKQTMSNFIKPSLRHTQHTLDSLLIDSNIPKVLINTYRLCLNATESAEIMNSSIFVKNVEENYKQQVEYSNLFSSYYDERLRSGTLQVFWLKGKEYEENNSRKLAVLMDGEFHQYEIDLPYEINLPIRFDPIDTLAEVEIKAIEVINLDGNSYFLDKNNDFDGLSIISGAVLMEKRDIFRILTINSDSQIHINKIASKLRITMKANNLVDPSLFNSLENKINRLIEESKKFQLEVDTKLINHLNEEIKNLSFNLENIQKELVLKNQELNKLQSITEERDFAIRQLHIKNQELNKLQVITDEKDFALTQLQNKIESINAVMSNIEDQNSFLQLEISKRDIKISGMSKYSRYLQSEIDKKDGILVAIYSSRAWRLIEKFRFIRDKLIKK
jgi:hypothetical protein